jgi:hypothetical protein
MAIFRPEVTKTNAAVDQARKRLTQALQEQDTVIIRLVACRLCKAPRGHRCHKGVWPYGVPTRSHTERRKDATT